MFLSGIRSWPVGLMDLLYSFWPVLISGHSFLLVLDIGLCLCCKIHTSSWLLVLIPIARPFWASCWRNFWLLHLYYSGVQGLNEDASRSTHLSTPSATAVALLDRGLLYLAFGSYSWKPVFLFWIYLSKFICVRSQHKETLRTLRRYLRFPSYPEMPPHLQWLLPIISPRRQSSRPLLKELLI